MPSARPLTVLIVDDADGAESLAVLLEMYGHSAYTAHDVEEAVRAARERAPDVVVLDIGLPCAHGFAVARELVALLERRPLLIAVSGYANLGVECQAAGIDCYFLKPVEVRALCERPAESDRRAEGGRNRPARRRRTLVSDDARHLGQAGGVDFTSDRRIKELIRPGNARLLPRVGPTSMRSPLTRPEQDEDGSSQTSIRHHLRLRSAMLDPAGRKRCKLNRHGIDRGVKQARTGSVAAALVASAGRTKFL